MERRCNAVIGDRDAHLARLVGAYVDKLASIRARRQADEIDQRRWDAVNTEYEIAMLQPLIDDADGIGVALRSEPSDSRTNIGFRSWMTLMPSLSRVASV
jgi:hypothetical protein